MQLDGNHSHASFDWLNPGSIMSRWAFLKYRRMALFLNRLGLRVSQSVPAVSIRFEVWFNYVVLCCVITLITSRVNAVCTGFMVVPVLALATIQ